MPGGYLLDEQLLPLPATGQLLAYAVNRSSHRDPSPYYHLLIDRHDLRAESLAARLAPPDRQSFLAALPPALRPHFAQHPGFAELPARLPYAVFCADTRPQLLWAYLWQSPAYRLRLQTLPDTTLSAPLALTGWRPIAFDGSRVLCLADPGRNALAAFALTTSEPERLWEQSLPGVFSLAAAGADGWLIACQRQRRHWLCHLDAGGRSQAEIPLKATPWSLAARGSEWAVGLKTGQLQTTRGTETIFDRGDGLFQLSFSLSGQQLILRSASGKMAVRRSSDARLRALAALPGQTDTLADGYLLLRQPGIACDDDRYWTLLGGRCREHGYPA